jgi:hypothetical protein
MPLWIQLKKELEFGIPSKISEMVHIITITSSSYYNTALYEYDTTIHLDPEKTWMFSRHYRPKFNYECD